MILNLSHEKLRPTAQEYQAEWAKELCRSVKPKDQASSSVQGSSELGPIADFLYTLPNEGPPRIVAKKFAQTRAVYLIGTILHIHTLRIQKNDELSAILLAIHFGLVDKVRVHNFHIYCYLRTDRVHVRIAQLYWDIVKFLLSYINRGPWVEREGNRERSMKITFDEFLLPAIAAREDLQPYAQLVCNIP